MKTLYYHGDIITVNDAQPTAEALLVENGKITSIGTLREVQALQDDQTTLVDLNGKTLLPGFIDGHGHIGDITAGLPSIYPPPNGVVNSKDMLFRELKALLNDGRLLENGWFVVTGYDNAFFTNEAHPTRAELDQISTDVPMLILHASGHITVVNSKAIEIAGWNKHTPNPAGGIIHRDSETGELNGILEEKAFDVIFYSHALIGISIASRAKMFMDAQRVYAQNGVTTAQEGATMADGLKMLQYCRDRGELLIDVVSYPMEEYAKELIPDNSPKAKYDRHLKLAGSKVVADGSPQAKTAWLTKPYYKQPDHYEEDYRGYPIYSDEQLYEFCKQAMDHNWQMLVHCNGDATADQFIHMYSKAKEDSGNQNDLRPVMIHAQTVREDQLDEMQRLGITPSYFHDHVYYWGDYHLDSVLGPTRGRRISPLKSSVDRGMRFTLHNDMPVTPINPIFSIHHAVNRKTRAGRDIGSEYAIDTMEAIKAITLYGAYQYFDEDIKGSLEVGKLADMVILDKNPLAIPKEHIRDVLVLETIKEGITIFKMI